jgi:hypothetical protein
MSRLKGGLHGLKADPSARANDQDFRHGVMLLVGPPGSRHARYTQPRRKMGGRLVRAIKIALLAQQRC